MCHCARKRQIRASTGCVTISSRWNGQNARDALEFSRQAQVAPLTTHKGPAAGGHSLAEALIALALGLTLIAALAQIFGMHKRAYVLLTAQTQIQESARVAFSFLGAAIRGAGYFGCGADSGRYRNALHGAWQSLPEFRIGIPVAGLDGGPDAWSPSLTTLPTNAQLYVHGSGINKNPYQPDASNERSGLPVPGTDMLMTRRLRSPPWQLAQRVESDAAVVIHIRDADQDGARDPGDLSNFGFPSSRDPLLVIADCQQATLFRVTSSTAASGRMRLAHTASPDADAFTNRTGDLSPDGQPYGLDTVVAAVTTEVFYIASGAGTNFRGRRTLSLWRKAGTTRPQELVEGIEDMQILYGLDSDGDGIPNRYLSRVGTSVVGTIASVRVSLLVASIEAAQDRADGLLRHSFTRNFAVRNP